MTKPWTERGLIVDERAARMAEALVRAVDPLQEATILIGALTAAARDARVEERKRLRAAVEPALRSALAEARNMARVGACPVCDPGNEGAETGSMLEDACVSALAALEVGRG